MIPFALLGGVEILGLHPFVSHSNVHVNLLGVYKFSCQKFQENYKNKTGTLRG
jgi:hypothetical protein